MYSRGRTLYGPADNAQGALALSPRPRFPAMPFCMALSLLLHINGMLWLGLARGPAGPDPSEPLRLALSRSDPENRGTPLAEPEALPEERHFVDIPDEKRDEGPPEAPTARVGIRNLRARDPGGITVAGETPKAESGSKAPIFRPGGPDVKSPLATRVPATVPTMALPGAAGPMGTRATTDLPAKALDGPVVEADDAPAPATPSASEGGGPSAASPPEREDAATVALIGKTADEERGAAPKEDEGVAKSKTEAEVRPARAGAGKPRPRVPPGPPRLVAKPSSSSFILAFPREGYIESTPDAGVSAKGAPQYNVKWDKYAPYYKHLFDRIRTALQLRSRLSYRRPPMLKEPRAITIGFRVTRNGNFEGLAILDDGDLVLIASDLADGVRSASPIDPFPDFVNEDYLDIRVRCYVE